MEIQGSVLAVVVRIDTGPKGQFAFCKADGFERSITISLSPEFWEVSRMPKPGDIVRLSDVKKCWRGWRAFKGSLNCS